MSLYRKYRPQTFSELIGQEQISGPLLKQLETGKISHAYLFSGPRGTGKTSTARIFAKALCCLKYDGKTFGEPCNECVNCTSITEGRYMDVLEIDAASNRGIDEIRDLREKIRLAPTTGNFKVYIIDEVHMLTNEAFNALLKTLEEPPEHAVFILATTELHKVPVTIQSRTQRFQVELPSRENRLAVLEKINQGEGFGTQKESLEVIVAVSEPTYRDTIVSYEKVSSVNPKAEPEEVGKILGGQSLIKVLELLNLVLNKNTKEAVVMLGSFVASGANVKNLTEAVIGQLRLALLMKVGIDQKDTSYLAAEDYADLQKFSQGIPSSKLSQWIKIFTASLDELKDSPIPSLPLELAIIEACEFNEGVLEETSVKPTLSPEVQIRVEKIEEKADIKIKKSREAVEAPAESKVEIQVTSIDKEEEALPEVKIVGGSVSAKDIEELKEKWPEVLKLVKPHNNSVEVFLRGAKLVGMDDDWLNLEVGYKFHKDMLEEAKNNRLLANIFSEVLGKPVRIKVLVGEKPVRVYKEEKPEDNPLDEADPVEIFGKLV